MKKVFNSKPGLYFNPNCLFPQGENFKWNREVHKVPQEPWNLRDNVKSMITYTVSINIYDFWWVHCAHQWLNYSFNFVIRLFCFPVLTFFIGLFGFFFILRSVRKLLFDSEKAIIQQPRFSSYHHAHLSLGNLCSVIVHMWWIKYVNFTPHEHILCRDKSPGS